MIAFFSNHKFVHPQSMPQQPPEKQCCLREGNEYCMVCPSLLEVWMSLLQKKSLKCFTFPMCLTIQLKLKSVEDNALWKQKSKVQETKSIPFKYPWSYTKYKIFQLCKMDTSLGTVSLVWLQKRLHCVALLFLPLDFSCTIRSVSREIVFPSLASSWLIDAVLKYRKLLWGMDLFLPWRYWFSMCTHCACWLSSAN